jgi:hypothetical protein
MILRVSILFLCVAAMAVATPLVSAQAIVRVEEDWELVVKQPDTSCTAPQVTCVISPVDHAHALHMAFEINHRTQPRYASGGMQVQLWDGERLVSHQDSPHTSLLQHLGETVRWTQCMQLQEGKLLFEIVKGSSTTWGTFGGQGYLKLAADTSLTDLGRYRTSVSLANSGMGYAANRVSQLMLKEVRVYTAKGLYATSAEAVTLRRLE